MDFRYYTKRDNDDDIIGYEWTTDNKTVVCFEFDNQVTEKMASAAEFKDWMCKLLYENDHNEYWTPQVSPNELSQYCVEKKQYEIEKKVTQKVYPNISDLTADFEKMEINKKPETKAQPTKPKEEVKQNERTMEKKDYGNMKMGDGTTLFQATSSLHELTENGDLIEILPKVFLFIKAYGKFDFTYEIYDEKGNIVYKRQITGELNYHVDELEALFKWVEIRQDNGEVVVYACRIPREQLNNFRFTFAKCLFENKRQETLEEVFKKDEMEYARRYVSTMDEENEEGLEDVNDAEDIEIEDRFLKSTVSTKGKNTGQTQAKVLDRTFVTRGPIISVYNTDEEEKTLEEIVSLPPVKTLDGSTIEPKKVMLNEQDTKAVLLNKVDDTKVYYMDLAKGKIVRELEVDGINKQLDVAPMSKDAEFTHNPVFVSMNKRNIFKMDPRQKENIAVSSKTYAKTPNFTCLATHNAEEAFAVGSETGEIRLYKEVGQNAKNLYQGFGDPILALDSTKDGKWLLATTKTYLILIPTHVAGKDGYIYPLGKENKNIPYKLTLNPDDIRRFKVIDISFNPAKFNDSKDGKEKYIVASTGDLLLTWNMKNILSGNVRKYDIKRLDDEIISNEFKYGREDRIFVTLPNEIRLQKAKKH